jgi:hypothetical protein
MKIAYFPNQIALNGAETLRAFLTSAKKFNFQPVENTLDADVAVIWSVLWNGRLLKNQEIYNYYRGQGKPVFILEVGALKRGYTWKVALNDITRNGIYANTHNLDSSRLGKIPVKLEPIKESRRNEILIACQHQKSHQWLGQPPIDQWLSNKIFEIRKYTDRPIVIRPHPRSQFSFKIPDVTIILPKKLPNTHEEYDIDYNYHCVINHNSGPSLISAIKGAPVICDTSSLAWPISGSIENIENISLPDRSEWFLSICHTEWTNDEILQGLPLSRLMPFLNS